MKNKEIFKIVMLPADNESQIVMLNNRLGDYNIGAIIDFKYAEACPEKYYTKQHLYIISSDEMNWNELVYDSIKNEIVKADEWSNTKHGYLKIIASTDKSITPNSWIGDPFVSEYIKAYNERKPIEYVELETEERDTEKGKAKRKLYQQSLPYEFTIEKERIIKTNIYGSVSIKIIPSIEESIDEAISEEHQNKYLNEIFTTINQMRDDGKNWSLIKTALKSKFTINLKQ